MSTEKGTDMQTVGQPVKDALTAFASQHGRRLHLEIKPGTFLVANAGSLVSTVKDIVSTGILVGPTGNEFLKLDTGMTEVSVYDI